jgi:hypothetical protein
MKKILTTAFVSLHVLLAGAQQNIINSSFEDTVIINDDNLGIHDTIAADWTSGSFGYGISDDAAEGNSAAYVWNWYYYGKGWLTNGDANLPQIGGTPIDFRPDILSGSYKYIIGDVQTTGDSGIAKVCLTKFNSVTQLRDTIGFGIKKLGPENAYKTFEVAINYISAEQPDTVTVTFISSENGFCSNTSDGNCLFLYFDNLNLSNSTGISESPSLTKPLIYPNPAKDVLAISFPDKSGDTETKVVVTNISGEKVLSTNLPIGTDKSISISHLSAGIYTIRIERAGDVTTAKLVKQ